MANGMLSQEKIDALLSGTMDTEISDSNNDLNENTTVEYGKRRFGGNSQYFYGNAATTLSQLVGKRVEITTPTVDQLHSKKADCDYPVPHVLIDVRYKKGIEGSNMLVLSREDGAIIVD